MQKIITATSPRPIGIVCIHERQQLADEAFESYEFGEGVAVVERDNWDTNDPLDLTKIVYVRFDDDAEEADSHKISFHVRFAEDGSVEDAYGLDMESGNDVGRRGDLQTPVTRSPETIRTDLLLNASVSVVNSNAHHLGITGDHETKVLHLLASLHEYCAVYAVDLDQQFAEVRRQIDSGEISAPEWTKWNQGT